MRFKRAASTLIGAQNEIARLDFENKLMHDLQVNSFPT